MSSKEAGWWKVGKRSLKNSKRLAKMNGNYSRGHCSIPLSSTVVHGHLLFDQGHMLSRSQPLATILEIVARKSKPL